MLVSCGLFYLVASALLVSDPPLLAGPHEMRLREEIKRNRGALPLILRRALWIGIALVLLQISVLGILAIVNPQQSQALLRFIGLTFVAGREPAMLVAFQANPPAPFAATVATAILGDLFVLFLSVPLVWLGLERLRSAYIWGGILLSFEKLAFEKRAVLRRFGILGLAAFIWLPGVGTGVLAAGAMGTIAKMPLRRLLIALAVSAAGVNVSWGFLMKEAATLIPTSGWWESLPLLLILVMLTLGIVFAVRDRRRRHILPLERFGILAPEHIERLLAVGIKDGVELLYVDCKTLAHNLGIPHGVLGRCRSVSELCLLESVTPRQAEQLTAIGIETVRDLSLVASAQVVLALHERGIASGDEAAQAKLAQTWIESATYFFAQSQAAATPPIGATSSS